MVVLPDNNLGRFRRVFPLLLVLVVGTRHLAMITTAQVARVAVRARETVTMALMQQRRLAVARANPRQVGQLRRVTVGAARFVPMRGATTAFGRLDTGSEELGHQWVKRIAVAFSDTLPRRHDTKAKDYEELRLNDTITNLTICIFTT